MIKCLQCPYEAVSVQWLERHMDDAHSRHVMQSSLLEEARGCVELLSRGEYVHGYTYYDNDGDHQAKFSSDVAKLDELEEKIKGMPNWFVRFEVQPLTRKERERVEDFLK